MNLLSDFKKLFFSKFVTIPSSESLMSDRKKFDTFLYTPVSDAIKELEQRKGDKKLQDYIHTHLPNGIPSVMRDKSNMVLFRHVATTNYEVIRFVIAADALDELNPLILEYSGDRFLSRNEWKHSLGKIRFHKGISKTGEHINESKVIINFVESDNKRISEVKTLWGDKLTNFHHEMFFDSYPHFKDHVFDVSDWLATIGKGAKEYYKKFLLLFLRDGILFENFLIDKKEKDFTKSIIIPAIQEIIQECGYKPLIVALEPTEAEGDAFWLSHPLKDKELVERKMKGNSVV